MPSNEERLVVALEARIKDFERNMQKAERTASKSYDGMRRGSKSATRQMQEDMARTDASVNKSLAMISGKIGAYSKAFAGGVVASLATAGLTEIVSKIAEVTQSVADVGRQARMAGVDVEAFQELKFAAEQNRIGVDVLVDGLKELNLRADEFIATGAGSAAEAFQRMGYSSEELAQKLKNPSALLVEIISRLGQFDRAAQIRISDEFFGGSAGERFVELVDKGAEGLREQIRYANELGLVMDKQMVAKAEEVDAKFNLIVTTVGTHLKSAIVSAVSAWFEFVDSYRDFENQQTETLQNKQTEIATKRLEIESKILGIQEQQRNDIEKLSDVARDLGFEDSKNTSVAGYTGQIDSAKRELAELEAEDARISKIINGRNVEKANQPKETFTPKDQSADYMREYRAELALSNRERMIAAETEKIMADAASKGASVTKEQAAALAEETVRRNESEAAARKGAAASEKAATATEAERKQVRELIAELQEELSLVWQSDVAKRAAAASRQAGAAATQQERDKIIQLNEALYQEQEAARLASERIEETKDMTKSFMFDMKDAVNSGESFWDSMGDAAVNTLDRITDKLLNEVIDALFQVNSVGKSGGGILGSLVGGLGSILGGGGSGFGKGYFPPAPTGRIGLFADGGISNKPAIFGEAGPEAAVPLPDGRRIPVDLGNSGGGGGGMDVRVDVGLTVDESGNLQALVKNISQKQVQKTVGEWAGSRAFARSVWGAMPQVNSWSR